MDAEKEREIQERLRAKGMWPPERHLPTEHRQLREAVIEAAKGLNRVVDPETMFVNLNFDDELTNALDVLYKTTDALQDFEQERKVS